MVHSLSGLLFVEGRPGLNKGLGQGKLLGVTAAAPIPHGQSLKSSTGIIKSQ